MFAYEMHSYNVGVSNKTDPSQATNRILALDVGSRRIGLAVSDALGITAQPLDTLNRKNKRADIAELKKVIKRHHVTEIVLGLPLNMNGDPGVQAQKIQHFAEELRSRVGLPVHLFDERLTSSEAHQILDDSGHSKDRISRKGKVDRIAAVLILQGFMQARKQIPVIPSEGRES
jgi:putative Holliday junction resolvase